MAFELDLRRFGRSRTPVLLLGGLNLARPLGMAGIPVIVASDDSRATAMRSRYAAGRLLLPRPAEHAEAAEALRRAGERIMDVLGTRVPLFYGTDDWLEVLQDYRLLLEPRFRLLLNDAEVGSALIDKQRFEHFARRLALPVPRALQWNELASHPGAVLAKPKVKFDFDKSAVSAQLFGGIGKARIFASGAEAAANPLAARLRHALLFQEYVAGDDRSLYSFHGFSDDAGRVLAWFVGRKLRTTPPLTGMSSYLELVHDPQLASLGCELAARIPLKGAYKLDFKRDSASGRWYLLEINARFNLWHHLGARNGINLPAIAYRYLVEGVSPSTSTYGTKARWVNARLDWRAFRQLRARGEISTLGWLWSLVCGEKVYDLFSWRDPLPFLYHLVGRLKRVPRLTLRLRRWLSTA